MHGKDISEILVCKYCNVLKVLNTWGWVNSYHPVLHQNDSIKSFDKFKHTEKKPFKCFSFQVAGGCLPEQLESISYVVYTAMFEIIIMEMFIFSPLQ